jgi:hypothetical protein
MFGPMRGDFFVVGIVGASPSVADHSLHDPFGIIEWRLHAPKATARENCLPGGGEGRFVCATDVSICQGHQSQKQSGEMFDHRVESVAQFLYSTLNARNRRTNRPGKFAGNFARELFFTARPGTDL